jgi:hypothetical protein
MPFMFSASKRQEEETAPQDQTQRGSFLMFSSMSKIPNKQSQDNMGRLAGGMMSNRFMMSAPQKQRLEQEPTTTPEPEPEPEPKGEDGAGWNYFRGALGLAPIRGARLTGR